MNIVALDKEFKKLELVENYINFRFEPKIQQMKGLKRHIFFEDLKNDFVNEVNTFGFSPYIQQTSDVQRKNKTIMSYKTNHMHDGFLNYVKLRNNEAKVINYRIDAKNEIKNKLKSRLLTKSRSKKRLCQEEKKGELISEREADKIKNDNFLQKALENLARNKMNLSDDDSNFLANNEKKFSSSREKENEFDKFKTFYVNSLTYKVNLNPLVSISDYSKPNPLKAKFEKFFTQTKTLQMKEKEIKKSTGLFKNKDILFTIKKSKLFKGNLEEETNKEINRNDVNFKPAIKIASQAKMSVFKRLSMVRPKTSIRESLQSKNINNIKEGVDREKISKHVVNDNINEEQFFNLIDISPNNLFNKANTNLKCNSMRKSDINIISRHK